MPPTASVGFTAMFVEETMTHLAEQGEVNLLSMHVCCVLARFIRPESIEELQTWMLVLLGLSCRIQQLLEELARKLLTSINYVMHPNHLLKSARGVASAPDR